MCVFVFHALFFFCVCACFLRVKFVFDMFFSLCV